MKLTDHIVPLLKDTDRYVRRKALRTLGRLPADELVKLTDHIVPLLKDTNRYVRRKALRTLEKLPVDELVKLRGCIAPRLQDPSGSVRLSALAALGKLPACELVALSDSIVPLLQDNRKEVRAEAFALFGQLVLTTDLISFVDKLRPALLLHLAAKAGGWPACVLLIRCGFSLEEKDRDGRTPWDIARRKGHLDLAKRLNSDFQKSPVAKDTWVWQGR